MITTITVNQWHIKWNAENPDAEQKPVICVNHYEFERDGVWGPKIGITEHYDEYGISAYERSRRGKVRVKYDPVNKTPCGASCWMEIVA